MKTSKAYNVGTRSLLGKTIVSIERLDDPDQLIIKLDNGEVYKMYHEQDCCESVRIEDIVGDLDDLLDSPLLEAEEVYNNDDPKPDGDYSHTWTFYKFGTKKGHVTLRWYEESNGYYGESAQIDRIA